MKTASYPLAVLLLAVMAFAVPQQINYQGYLTRTNGTALDTTVAMTFKLYADSAGTGLLWTENRPSVPVTGGSFGVRLGQIAALSDAVLNQTQLWVGITVGNNSEMTPRMRVVSTGYSYRVGTVDGASGGVIDGTLNAGTGNSNSGSYAMVFGEGNNASGQGSTVTGGAYSEASGFYSSVGGGQFNHAQGSFSVVSGGGGGDDGFQINTAGGDYSTIGGGSANIAGGFSSTVGGGFFNRARGNYSVVAGGGGSSDPDSNAAVGDWSFVGGGGHNVALGQNAVVSGGSSNTANFYGAIGGGAWNTTNGQFSTVGGGENNHARGQYSVVSGGGGNTAADSNSAFGEYSVIGGGLQNKASAGASTIGGGSGNIATGSYSTVGGGVWNTAGSGYATVAGGNGNAASGFRSTVCGGDFNRATGELSFIGGGWNNVAGGTIAIVAGGTDNQANGQGSYAAGFRLRANHLGSIVLGYSDNLYTNSFADRSFTVRCAGGARFYTDIDNTTTGVELSGGGGSWQSLCDVRKKNLHGDVNTADILQKISVLPLHKWSYKSQSDRIQHIGPTAQDFYVSFGLGESDTTINTLDPDGVALAAIQELAKQVQELKSDNLKLQAQVQSLTAAKQESAR